MPTIDTGTLFILFALAFVGIFILGATNRVVIFTDNKDFGWTCGIFGFPILGVVLAFIFGIIYDDAHEQVITISAVLSALDVVFCIGRAYYTSVKANGVGIGIVIGTFKILASVFLLLLTLGLFTMAPEDENGEANSSTWIFAALIVGMFSYLLAKIINGEAVADRRLELAENQ